MKLKYLLFLILFGFAPMGESEEIDMGSDVYFYVSDIYNPTLDDLKTIQYALTYSPRPLIKRLEDREFVPREFKIIGNSLDEIPERGMVAVNSDIDERENCIIIYSSFNKRYPLGLRRLVSSIEKSDFKGHVHFCIGGWPNLEEGDLVLAHVPYAFKVCFFREVKRLGYKRVLWLDASILPSQFTSLNHIFKLIENNGYFVQGNDHVVGAFMNEQTAEAFGLTVEKTKAIPSCSAAILGLDLTSQIGLNVLSKWFNAAKHPCAFYSARSDQSALSIIFYQLGVTDFFPLTTLARIDMDNPHALFIMDRDFVKY